MFCNLTHNWTCVRSINPQQGSFRRAEAHRAESEGVWFLGKDSELYKFPQWSPWRSSGRPQLLGVFYCSRNKYKCMLYYRLKPSPPDHHYRCANAVFGKIGRIASEEVTHEIIRCKCISIEIGICCTLYTVSQKRVPFLFLQ